MAGKKIYEGGCLCEYIRFVVTAPVSKPHTCSCKLCQRHTGALTLFGSSSHEIELRGWGRVVRQRLGDPRTGPAVLFAAHVAVLLVLLITSRLSHCFLACSNPPTEKNLRRRPIRMLGEGQSGGTSFQMQVPTNNAVSFILRD